MLNLTAHLKQSQLLTLYQCLLLIQYNDYVAQRI